MDKIDVFVEAVKNMKTVGTITFSSKFLVEKMIEPINFSKERYIVELGGGDGCITKALLTRMRPDAKLLVFEINDKFVKMLQSIKDERLIVIHDSAEKLDYYLQQHNIPVADSVVSALPLVWLPNQLGQAILKKVTQCLKPSGLFIQLSYTPTTAHKFKKLFPHIRYKFTLLNLPPAFVFVCQRQLF